MKSTIVGIKCLETVILDWSDVPMQEHKYVPLERFLQNAPSQARILLRKMTPHLRYEHKKILVDFKVRYLREGQGTCGILDWHYDCVKDKDSPLKEENHLLYTNTNGTMFAIGDAVVQANDGEIWQYGRDLHRGTRMKESGKRVLLRLTETDMGR